ncbi:MAG: hypothetical protein JWM76_3949, partial [Pseudonocardiales bacterium]|nr:hypothetical protein [Pseudonocardiales bacterium]
MADSKRAASFLPDLNRIPDLLRRSSPNSGRFDVPRRLSALDNAFLSVESDRSPMHVSGLAVYRIEAGRGEPIDVVTRAIERVLPHIPALRRKLLPSLPGAPRAYWGRPGSVDLTRHVHPAELDAPGAREQLLELTAQLHEHRLDRSIPLWQAYVITGLEPPEQRASEPGGVAFAVLFKVHHAAVDGLTAMTLFAGLHQRRPFDPAGADDQPPPPGNSAAAAVAASRSALTNARALADEGVDTLVAPLRSTIKVARALAHRHDAEAQSPALLLPWTKLNGNVSPRRS